MPPPRPRSGASLLRRAIASHERAIAATETGRLTLAERATRRALALYSAAEGPRHPDVANALVLLGQIRTLRDDLTETVRCYRRARAILPRPRPRLRPPAGTGARDNAAGDDEEVERLRMRATLFLGSALRAQGRFAPANAVLASGLKECVARVGPRDPLSAGFLNDLGVLRKYQGRFDEAAAFYQRARAIIARSPQRRGLAAATLYHNLGGLAHSRGQHAHGEPFARRSVALREALLGPDHPEVGADVAALAALVEGQGHARLDEAARLYQRALRIFRRTLGPASGEVAINLCSLGGVRQAQGRLAVAEGLIRRALAIQVRLFGHQHADVAMTVNNLGILLSMRTKAVEARRLCRRALAIFHRALGPRHPHTRLCRANVKRLESDQPRRSAHRPARQRHG
jgi:tetratricopeptide (TPR) repeat protein